MGYDRQLGSLLLPLGFCKERGNYFRLHGDGVLQSVFFPKERTKTKILGISVQSVYSRRVFEPVDMLHGQMHHPYEVSHFCGYRDHAAAIWNKNAVGRGFHMTVDEQIQIFREHCLPVLEETNTQAGVCELLFYLDIRDIADVCWNDPYKIAPLVLTRRFSDAKKCCEAILAQRISAMEANRPFWPRSRMDETSQEIEKYQTYIKWIESGEYDQIFDVLQQQKTDNLKTLEFLCKLYP